MHLFRRVSFRLYGRSNVSYESHVRVAGLSKGYTVGREENNEQCLRCLDSGLQGLNINAQERCQETQSAEQEFEGE